jgi:nucleotide-binding universal stress UspA family protein
MYNRILVLLDGSTRAETILPHVKHLAKLDNSTVVLLQVVEPTPTYATSYELTSHWYSEDRAKQWIQEAQEYLEGVQNDFHEMDIASIIVIAHGPVVGSILDVAQKEDADLIALASHGRTGLASVFYGSKAAGVLQQVDRPLLLVRVGKE